jgi:hypothetical protein
MRIAWRQHILVIVAISGGDAPLFCAVALYELGLTSPRLRGEVGFQAKRSGAQESG